MNHVCRAFLVCCLLTQCCVCAMPAEQGGDVGKKSQAPGVTTDDAEAERANARWPKFLAAKVKIAERKFDEALREVKSVETETPQEEVVKLILLGRCHEGLVDFASALAAYKKAQSLGPPGAIGVLRRASVHYRSEDFELAKDLLREYIKVEPGNPEAYFYLVMLTRFDINPDRAMYARKVILLDGPDGFWSKALLHELESAKKRAGPPKVDNQRDGEANPTQ